MTTARIAKLVDRGIVAVTGPDSVKFLQGLVTNDIEALATVPDQEAFDAGAAHAGLLSPQGKILFDFFCVRTPEGFVLETSRERVPDLVKRLSMYKLRAQVDIKDVSAAFSVLALWGSNACSSGPTTGTIAFRDPRHPELGARILAKARFASDIASATNGHSGPPEIYHAHRIALGVPEGGKDYAFGDAYPHEADFDIFNGVSFTKGCYVGQEIVARMQHKTVVRKRVVRVEGDEPLTSDADVTGNGVTLGRIGSVDGCNALALLRLDRFIEAMATEDGVRAGGIPIGIRTEDLKQYLAAQS